MSSPFFGSGGETNTRTKNYLTVGPSGSGASLYLSFGLPSRPRSLAKRDTKKEEERERIGFEEAIHRETGWGEIYLREPSVSFEIQLQMQCAKSSLSMDTA